MFSVAGLAKILTDKGVLTGDEANEAYAIAASMGRANEQPGATALIETMVPETKTVDPVAKARARGQQIHKPG